MTGMMAKGTPRYRCFWPLVAASLLLPSGAARADDTWDSLTSDLAGRDSATATLQHYCPAPVEARKVTGKQESVTPAEETKIRKILLDDTETRSSEEQDIEMRHIQLVCGDIVFSDAFNFYLPSRLTPEARQKLADGHTPFGRAVGAQNFIRKPLDTEYTSDSMTNRAVLYRREDNKPFSVVIERYTLDAAKKASGQ